MKLEGWKLSKPRVGDVVELKKGYLAGKRSIVKKVGHTWMLVAGIDVHAGGVNVKIEGDDYIIIERGDA